MALSTPCSVWAKIKNWHSKLWNLLETLAIIIFIIGTRDPKARPSPQYCSSDRSDLESLAKGFFLRSTALFKYSPLHDYPRLSPITNKTISEPELTPKEITLIGYGRAFYSGVFSNIELWLAIKISQWEFIWKPLLVDLAIWLTRIFKFCSVNKTLGPYVTMAGKMMVDMFSFIFLLFIGLWIYIYIT